MQLQRRYMAGTLGASRSTSVPQVEVRKRGAMHPEALAAKRKEIMVSGASSLFLAGGFYYFPGWEAHHHPL